MEKILYTIIVLCFPLMMFAQNTTIKGKVTDKKGGPIIGANVALKDTYDGASTDLEGKFSFVTSEKGDLFIRVTYLGFEAFEQAVKVNGAPVELSITLKEAEGQLKEITITAGSFEASDAKKGTVLKPLDIVTTAGALGDIAGALNTLPGTSINGESGELFVRGGTGSETQTYVDGMTVGSPYTANAPDVPSRNRFSPFLFKGTIFSTGGYSAEYGQALSSALILNSQDLGEQNSTSLFLSALGGGLSKQYAKPENYSISGSVNYMNLAPYFALVKQNYDWEHAPENVSGTVIYRKQTSKTGIFKAYASASYSTFRLKYPAGDMFFPSTRFQVDNDNYYLNMSYREQLNDKWNIFTAAAVEYDRRQIKLDTSGFNALKPLAQGRVTINGRFSDRIRVKIGSEYIYRWYSTEFNAGNTSYKLPTPDHLASGYAETDIYFTKYLVGRFGVRGEYSSILDRPNVAPRASLAYKLSEASQFSFAYGEFYQTPDYQYLRYTHDLLYEHARHLILNYQYMRDDRIFRIEGYLKNYSKLIKVDYSNDNIFDPRNPINAGSGFARGFDVFWRDQKSVKYLDYWISYSWVDTKRDFLNYPYEAYPTFAANHNLSVVGKYFIPSIKTSLNLTYQFNSGRPYNDPNIYYHDLTQFNSQRAPAYHNVSAAANYLTNFFGNFTVVVLSVNNLLGLKQVFGYRYAATPDSQGIYQREEVTSQASTFVFLGCFISFGQKPYKPN